MIAFMFAGQGSQYPNMGSDLYNNLSKDIFENIPYSLKEILLSDSNIINDTKYAQAAIFSVSYILAKHLSIKPDYVLGMSLGEYTALCYSEVFSFSEGLNLVSNRGLIMSNELKNTNSGMYAVITNKDISAIINKYDGVWLANDNTINQIVISGYLHSLSKVAEELCKQNIKCIKLNVYGAFHSPLLNNASLLLKEELNKYNFKKPIYKIIFNNKGSECHEDIKDILVSQIKSPVLFKQSIQYLINIGVTTFIEIGSKNILTKLVKKINNDVEVLSIYNYESLMKVRNL